MSIKNFPLKAIPISSEKMQGNDVDANNNLISKDGNSNNSNESGPKHVDSISIMRKKRIKLFEETHQFYQDSVE